MASDINQCNFIGSQDQCHNTRPAHNSLNLSGRRFSRLLVLEKSITRICRNGDKKSRWVCQCDCGETLVVDGSSLTTGNTTSCGCLAKEKTSERSTSHGQSKTRTYRIWRSMHTRCENKKCLSYADYGGRGIKVCERWGSFENFLKDMGEAVGGASIERKNNDGNYEPSNCHWADRYTQSRNKRNNRMLTLDGVTKCMKDWANSLGMNQSSLAERLDKWPLELALTTPKTRN